MSTKPALSIYGNTEGPLGFPMPDKQARVLETILKTLPKSNEFAYRKSVVAKAPTELSPGERSDVSWISTESVDRMAEVVVARGMNDSQFQGNPLVTLNHAYWMPPVAKSLWRKRVKDGDLVGIKAKTQYPAKPDSWGEDAWPPDKVFSLVQAGMLQGKSIGFLPTKVHIPDEKEMKKNDWSQVGLVIDEWILLEYACCFLPANQDSLVDQVSKGALDLPSEFYNALGVDKSLFPKPAQPLAKADSANQIISYTTMEEIERILTSRIAAIDFEGIGRKYLDDAFDKIRGKV
jgi:hypothetical protein